MKCRYFDFHYNLSRKSLFSKVFLYISLNLMVWSHFSSSWIEWLCVCICIYILLSFLPPTFYVQSLIKRAHYALSIGHNEDTELFSLPVLNWISMTLFRFELQLTYMVQKLLPTFKHPNIVYINNYIELYINTNIDL